jgi:hypothetical protein
VCIEEDQVRRRLGDLAQGLSTISRPDDLVVVDREKGLQEVQILLLVIHHQDARLSFLGQTPH